MNTLFKKCEPLIVNPLPLKHFNIIFIVLVGSCILGGWVHTVERFHAFEKGFHIFERGDSH